MDTIMLCFRDLVTDRGVSIAKHEKIATTKGHTWWGWWKKPIELIPTEALRIMDRRIADDGRVEILLFDCGQYKVYSVKCVGIHVASLEGGVFSPEVDKTPDYYSHIKCALWLKVVSIRERSGALKYLGSLFYRSFPSWPKTSDYSRFVGKHITSFKELDEMAVTMWHLSDTSTTESSGEGSQGKLGKKEKARPHAHSPKRASSLMALAGIDSHDLVCRLSFL